MGNYNRYSIRLAGYDYSRSGYYFITLVTQNRDTRFGVIRNDKMELNNAGRMINREWNQISQRFKNAVLDKYIIMPNHFHGIIQIISNKTPPQCNENNVGTPLVGIQPKKLSVQNKNPYLYPEKMSVYNKLPFLKSSFVKIHNINSGSHDYFNGSPDDYIETRNFYGGLQCTGTSPVPTGKNMGKTSLLDIIGAFKSISTNMYINGVNYYKWPRFDKRLWQLRFHDRIIRTENELNGIRKYIITNPENYHPRTK